VFGRDGGVVAATTLEGPGFASARNLAFTPDGGLIAAGRHQGELRVGDLQVLTPNLREDLFVLRMDAQARPRRLLSWGGPGDERSRVVRVDASGLVTIAGRFEYHLAIGNWEAEALGGSDGYLAQVDLERLR